MQSMRHTEEGMFNTKAVSDQKAAVTYEEVVLLLCICEFVLPSHSVHADSLCSGLQHGSRFLCRQLSELRASTCCVFILLD